MRRATEAVSVGGRWLACRGGVLALIAMVLCSSVAAAPGASRLLSVAPASVSFGSWAVGQSSTSVAVVLTNTGSASVNLSKIATAGDFAQTHACSNRLAAGAKCSISVTFTPSAAGTRSGALTISSNASNSPATVSLSGTGTISGAAVNLTPTSLVFGSQDLGSTSAAQDVALKNSGNASLGISSITASGDYAATSSCGSSLAAGASCSISVRFSPTVAGTRSGTLSVVSNAASSPDAVSLSGTGNATTGALTLISRGIHVVASSASYPAAYAVDADYNTEWRSAGVPATLAFDLSSLPSASRQSVLLVWYNDATYGYDHALAGQVGYNNPGAYAIEVNAASGGGAPPASGWVTLAQVSRNVRHSLEHVLDLGGYPWLRLNFSASDGSGGNSDIAINVDLYSSAAGVTDGWFFAGDSITANCMGHRDLNAYRAPAFGSLIRSGNPPPQENAGMPGWTTSDLLGYFAGWVAAFPGKYVTINLGTNDAVSGISPSEFYLNLSQLVQTVLNAGKLPLVPTIPYSLEAAHKASIPGLNSKIRDLYAAYPAVIPGPDLYAYYQANPDLIAADGVHLTDQGCAAYREIWANTALGSVY